MIKNKTFRRVFVSALSVSMLLGSTAVRALTTDQINIYVAVDGSDSNTGLTPDSPLATFNAAKGLANSLKGTIRKGSINVNFDSGEYYLDSTVTFKTEDSGSSNVRMVYKAVEGARPVFVGCRDIDVSKFHPVTDPAIRACLRSEVRDKIGVVDLRECGINKIDPVVRSPIVTEIRSPFCPIYVNDNEQIISKYPNEGWANVKEVIRDPGGKYTLDSESPGAPAVVFDTGLERTANWGNATEARIEGYFMYNWSFENLFFAGLTKEGYVKTRDSYTTYGIKNDARYHIINLMEEIDIPGEYFVDTNNFLLYFYPPYPVGDATVQIAVRNAPLVKMDSVKYINFENLNFAKNRSNAIEINDVEHLSFLGCEVRNMSNGGIVGKGNTVTIKSCNFSDIGSNCIDITGGDLINLVPAYNLIENNHCCRYSRVSLTYTNAIKVQGMGTMVRNNLIHNAPHQGIWFAGNSLTFTKNELYNVLKDTMDCGAIYAGRAISDRGNEISYNYIHDTSFAIDALGRVYDACTNVGVYMDDMQAGSNIHHNIFANFPRGVMIGGGQDIQLNNNIFFDCLIGYSYDQRAVRELRYEQTLGPGGEAWNKMMRYPVTSPTWQATYPVLKGITQNDRTYPKGAEVIDNLTVFGNKGKYFEDEIWGAVLKTATVRGNIQTQGDDMFVDAANQDFRIKDESILAKAPGLAECSTLDTGIYVDEYRKTLDNFVQKSFRKISPKNKYSDINNLACYFSWDYPVAADTFTLTIARDPELKDVVRTVESKDNHIIIEGLEANETTYYWDVVAHVTGRTIAQDVYTSDGVASFTTSRYDLVDRTDFDSLFSQTNDAKKHVVEGDAPGEYKSGTLIFLDNILASASSVGSKAHPRQEELDVQSDSMRDALANIKGRRNTRYINFSDILSAKPEWVSQAGSFNLDGDTLTFSGRDATGGTFDINPQVYEALCCKMKLNYGKDWVGISFRQTDPRGLIWDSVYNSSGYIMVIKPEQIEFQRFNSTKSTETFGIIPNTFFKNDIEYNMVFESVDTSEGVRNRVLCDGQVVFEFLDKTPVYDTGCFALTVIDPNGYIKLSPADTIPTGEIEK